MLGFLCEYLEENGEVDVFIEFNNNFCLFEDFNIFVIMVGLGIGIVFFCLFM